MLSASNPKFYKKIVKATCKLVNSLTDFEESSENHEVCKEYALSQFGHHRFLDVDSCKVERRVKGLAEKFIVHSKPQKAEIFKKLASAFLEADISDASQARSEIHYSLLAIALDLSRNPVNTDYVAPIRVKPEEEEKFDWAKYLLEGEEMPYPSQWMSSDTPYGSEDEEDSQCHRFNGEPSIVSQDKLVDDDEGYSVSRGFQPSQKLVPEYWKTSNSSTLASYAIFTDDTTLHIPLEANISEVNVLREVLWLLAGASDLFVFPIINGKHAVTDKVVSYHSTPSAFKSALESIAKYGDIIKDIQSFVFVRSRYECQTYQSFSEALLTYVTDFQAQLKSIERKLLMQEETILLGDLIKILSPRFAELSEISTVLENSIHLDRDKDSNAHKSSRLLGALYHCLLDQTNKGLISGSKFQDSLIHIWIDTLAPYFKIMDGWMSFGSLIDPHEEFVLQRSTSCLDVQSELFWTESISLASEETAKYLSWLTPVLRSIVVCGKSVEILVSLGKSIRQRKPSTLHENFCRYIFSVADNDRDTADEDVSKAVACSDEKGTCDAILRLSFERLFQPIQTKKDEASLHFESVSPFPVLVRSAMSKLVEEKLGIADRSLLDVFLKEYSLVSMLKCFHKFHLMEWGDVMYDFTSSIFGKISSGEYWMDMMGLHAAFQDAITTSDPEANFLHVSVSLNKEKQKPGSGVRLINATDVIELNVDVKWPLNIIITEKCRYLYNTLFSYLLQVKRALFCLEHLNFDAIYAKSVSGNQLMNAHRLSLLRTKLLRLILHWHNFIMTSVIQSEKEAFLQLVETAENVDKIIVAHHRFLDRILSLSLLKEEKQAEKMIQGTLRKIFDLSVVIHSKWNKVGAVSTEGIKKCEAEYREYSEFLGIILQNLVSRGAVPLSLESLAFCLMS